MRHILEINHSVFSNNDLVTVIKDCLTRDIGLSNFGKDLAAHYEADVSTILQNLAKLSEIENPNSEYSFIPAYGDHLFIISKKPLTTAKIERHAYALRKLNTSFSIMRIKDGLIFKVNKRYYPLSGVDQVVAETTALPTIFNGCRLLKDVYQKRRVVDTRDLWSLTPDVIKTNIKNLIETMSMDIRMIWFKPSLSPVEALHISERMLECMHTLLCLVEINNAYTNFTPRKPNSELAIEALDMALGKFHNDPRDPVPMTELLLSLSGSLAERLVMENYQHLFRGLMKS